MKYEAPANRVVRIPPVLRLPSIGRDDTAIALANDHWKLIRSPSPTSALLTRSHHPVQASARGCPLLTDELQNHLVMDSLPSAAETEQKSRMESNCAETWLSKGRIFLGSSAEEFVANIVELRTMATSLEGSIRTVPVIVRKDSRGNLITYPPPFLCKPLLFQLHRFLSANIRDNPALCATVLFVGIIHSHPFEDGNGRTARVAYNILTSQRLGRPFILPILEIAMRNSSAFLLKLRRSIYQGDWHAIQSFFTGAACELTAIEPRSGCSQLQSGCRRNQAAHNPAAPCHVEIQ